MRVLAGFASALSLVLAVTVLPVSETVVPVAAAETATEAPQERPLVVVTTEVLGAIVGELAGDAADVTVLMGGGADPHSWQPSARDSEALFEADLIVANGLDLEEGLVAVLEQAEADGVAMFHATDHVDVRAGDRAEAGQPDQTDEDVRADDPDGHDHETGDPHFWLDPLAMRDVVLALGPVMAESGLEVADRVESLAAELEALDADIAALLAAIPDERRQLVTGHRALGYFADRYGFSIVGSVIPGLSTSDEPSARDLAELIDAIRQAGASVVFNDVATPPSVAQAVASETGARIVDLRDAQLPESGSYLDLMRDFAATLAGALAQ